MTPTTTGAAPDFEAARAIADAVLFEGYLLYPYRASATKNQARFQFGVLAPNWAHTGDATTSHTECLLEAPEGAHLETRTRFLRLRTRHDDTTPEGWDEGEPTQITTTLTLHGASTHAHTSHEQPATDTTDTGAGGARRAALRAEVHLNATRLPGPYRLWRLRLDVTNTTPDTAHTAEDATDRTRVLRRSLVACHTLMGVRGGAFVSSLEPPAFAAAAAAACRNEHAFPVLAGPPGRRDLMLSAPIILYDHPRIAPESPTDLCDATEIDEILLLRTMTLTEEEKRQSRATDPRAATIIDVADGLPPQLLERLHGTLRYLRQVEAGPAPAGGDAPASTSPTEPARDGMPVPEAGAPWWDPASEACAGTGPDGRSASVGVPAPGARVRLRAGRRRADAQDMFLHGRHATVRAVLTDVDGATHIAVTLDDDPLAGLYGQTGRYLYFDPDEIEAVEIEKVESEPTEAGVDAAAGAQRAGAGEERR
jgi:hypothetical protein